MGTVFKNAKVFLGGYELTGDMNRVNLDYTSEGKDATVFGNASRVMQGGLKDAKAAGGGFWGAGVNSADQVMFDGIGLADQILTLFAVTPIEGSTSTGSGYAFKVTGSRYSLGDRVGELLPFDFEAEGRGVGT